MEESNKTLQYYAENAAAFAAGTVDADMSVARERFLSHLPQGARILDFGCGSGRDTRFFLSRGYDVDAVDGSAELCRMASQYTGIEVKQMLFGELDASAVYDGVWACASILHLPKPELAEVLRRIADALTGEGVLYTSFKYGSFEGIRGGRHFTDFTEETLRAFWQEAFGLRILELWITQDVRPGRAEERWLNVLAGRVGR